MPEDKGQNFVTQRNLKNELFGKRNEDVGALNRTMSSFATNNIKSLNSLNKSIQSLNENISQLAKPTQQKKDFVRKEDPTKKLIKEVDDLEELFRENNKLQKEKKKGNGLLGLLGGLSTLGAGLAGAGIIGYLLTGKKELLNNVWKSVVKYLPTRLFFKVFDRGLKWIGGKTAKLFKPVLGWFGKGMKWVGSKIMKLPVVKSIGSKITKFMKPLQTIGKELGENLLKKGTKFIRPLASLFKGFGKMWKPLTSIFSKGAGKFGGKAGAKLGKLGLKAFKGIPVISTIIGTFFAFQKWKKGDKVGAMMEITSGLLGNIPFAAYALDALILVRDLIGPKKVDSIIGGVGKKTGSAIGKMSLEVLRHTPGIGTIMRFKDGLDKWKTDKVGAIIEFGGAISTLVPGGSLIFDTVVSIAKWFKKKDVGKKVTEEVGDFMSKAKDQPVAATKDLLASGADAVVKGAKEAPGNLWDWTKKKVSGAMSSASAGMQDFLYEKPQPDGKQRGIDEIAGVRGEGWYTYKPWSPIIEKLNPKVWDKFKGMASEYHSETGKSIQINSAYRNQKDSLHGQGYAIDMNSTNANELESMGLMEKWGFHRPLIPKLGETWHVEPYPGKEYGKRNTNNYPIRRAVAQGNAEFEIGGDNLPASPIPGKIMKSSNQKIDLSDNTIQALAQAMGASFKGAWPKSRSGMTGANIAMRG